MRAGREARSRVGRGVSAEPRMRGSAALAGRFSRRPRPTWLIALAAFFAMGVLHAAPVPDVDVRFDQRIGERLPLDTTFTDATGARRPLRSYFHGTQPVVLYFGYAKCPQLCTVVADATVSTLRHVRESVGRDFQVVSISIDPTETADENRGRQERAVKRYGREDADAGWHTLTGDAEAIHAVTAAAGFHFKYDPDSRQFAHPSGFVVVTPQGVISRYFFGVDFASGDVATALRRAGDGRTGEPVFALLLKCFHGDGITGRYGKIIWHGLWVAVSLTVAALVGGIGWMLAQEWRQRRRAHALARESGR